MFKAIADWVRHKARSSDDHSETETTVVVESSENTDSRLVPYDENLLERSRTQWQFGDWQSLAQLQRETLQHHPDRAKLALLAAAGHQQLGNMSAARQFTRLAQDWGCNKKLISQILIAGVHNTLGRASAIGGRQQQALQHFENSVKIATPGGDLRLLVQARAREELAQLGFPSLEASQHAGTGSMRVPVIGSAMQQIAEQLQKQNAALSEQIKKQNADLISVGKSLESTVKKEMLNATQQLEAFQGIQSFLNHGEHLPRMHGWPISPDFALYLIELIDSNDYDLILEFGSGTSTVLIAKALARIGRQRHSKPATSQVAFEHLEQYHAQTLANLKQSELADAVQLVLAPLQPYQAPNGKTYSYYSCHTTLKELAQRLPVADLKVLMVVDGPPAATGQHARYPAVPAVLAQLKSARIDILLDDYIRDDEKEIAQLWLKDIEAQGLSAQMTTQKMEKDACLISVYPQHGK
ncbi:methyltransferase FkbM [Pseudomonas umsongensis]|uniref:class I SAM-dependent methyltransferase n=1 Tax=Pseudomonas umsongensis TaxID=198618 RepID=UPI001246BE15|nr:class I SAM-dependent methyltransferase [Pseudomonas umsongensis]QFG28869.1 methyltransferase FkbM [Pseudomonas umsongensis]